MSFIVGIDGPAGSGKGTVTKQVANKLGLINIDTGSTYRCVALESINQGVTLEDKEKIIEIAKTITIEQPRNAKLPLPGAVSAKWKRSYKRNSF